MRRLFQLTLLLVLAFTLRVHLLGNQELRGDEGFSWNYIQDSPAGIFERIIREGDPQPPIHYWLLWGWAKLTGDSEFALRAWSALTSLILVPLIYQVGRRLWRDEVGFLAAGLTAIHPQQIWLAQDVRNMYQLALIALLASTLILPRLVVNSKYWLAYVICGALAMYSHYYALFVLTAHGAYVITRRDAPAGRLQDVPPERLAGSRRWVAAGLTIAALVAPWAFIILPVYSHGQLAQPGSINFLAYSAAVFGDLAAGPVFPNTTKTVIVLAASTLCLIPLINSLYHHAPTFSHSLTPSLPRTHTPTLPHAHTHTPPHSLLLASILLPFLGIYAVVALRSTFNSFYFVFAFPAFYLLAAGGVFILFKKFPPLGAAVILAGIITLGIGLGNHYYDPQYSKTRGMRGVAARLAEAARPGDAYLANFPDPAQVYYVRHLRLNWHMLPGEANFESAQMDAALAELLTNRVWFVPVNAIQLDPKAYVQNRLLDTALLAEDERFNKMRLMLFLPPSMANPLNARFDDGISLVGYYLTPNRLTLVWRADSTPSADYTVFVHALAADSYNVIGHDAPPTQPTSTWPPGQPIIDIHEFEIPTDQPISLVAGLYNPTTGERVRIKSAAFGESDAALVTQRISGEIIP